MKPDRAAMLLRGVLGSIDTWAEECRELAAKCPQAAHLCAAMEQARASLRLLIEREDTDP